MVSWITGKLEVRKSPIHGLGLFAREAIAAGEVCARLDGREIDDTELDALVAGGKPFSAFALGGGRHILQSGDDLTRFGNHSCDPSLEWDGSRTLHARRAIAPGEEATVDYAPMSREGWSMPCNCGAKSCRGAVHGLMRR
jgi:SET domain-containing protein